MNKIYWIFACFILFFLNFSLAQGGHGGGHGGGTHGGSSRQSSC